MRSLFTPFRRLRWKLTFSYTLVTVLAVLLLEIIALAGLIYYISFSPIITTLVEQEAARLSIQVRPFLAYETGDPQALEDWLRENYPSRPRGSAVFRFESGPHPEDEGARVIFYDGDLAVVVDAQGEIIAANASEYLPESGKGDRFFDPLVPEESRRLLDQALRGESNSLSLEDNISISAAPIRHSDGRQQGALYLRLTSMAPLPSASILPQMLLLLGWSALLFTVGAGLIGTIFGFITARGLARRLRTVSESADAWSRGDFSAFIKDTSGDELAQLAGRLNRMAEHLQNLLQTRQELAAIEERNRLARDLHDSVKQQVFATAMQVGAARAVLEKDPGAAASRLDEAERLAQQAQRELTALIRELRPAALDGEGLVGALREHLANWSRQNGIAYEFKLQGERRLPLPVEQALFRVAQEALTNVARHSGASSVEILLSWEESQITLTISDNGRGFDVSSAQKKGIGLHSMQERVDALGGTLNIESSPDGARVSAMIPTAGKEI